MDPQTLWNEIVALVNTPGNNSYNYNPSLYMEFYDKMRDLSDWLHKGGFPPIVNLESEMDRVSLYCYDCESQGQSFRIFKEYSKSTEEEWGYFFTTYDSAGNFTFSRPLG